MTTVNLQLLGDFEAYGPSGNALEVSARKCRALLGILALSPFGSAPRQRLAGLIWSDRGDEQARSSLRQALATLRREFAGYDLPIVVADDRKVTLDLTSVEIDVVKFQKLAASDDVSCLRQALSLYRGEFLADIMINDPAFEDWLQGERARLHALAVMIVDKLWKLEATGNRIDLAKRLVSFEPLRESAHAALMQAYSETGENALALQHYAACRALLKAELGIAPGREIEMLRQRILNETSSDSRIHKDAGPADGARPHLSLPDKPSIAVLPFTNLSGDSEQEYFADGVVEEIITALSRIRWLFVIARNSSFIYKGRTVDVKQVGRELGVRYVLEGSVRKSGSKLRIAGQLIDASNSAQLWAERFDGNLEDIFDLQDQVTSSVVGAMAPKLEQAEIERSRHKPTENLDAYDYYLRGLAVLHLWSQEGNREALSHFYKAIELDPGFAAAHGMAARTYVQRNSGGWMTGRVQAIAEAEKLARRAVELGEDDAVALCSAGFALADICGAIADGDAFIDRAIDLNPNLAAAWLFSGWAKASLGDADTALERLARAKRLSPYDPQMFSIQGAMAFSHFIARHYAEALAEIEAGIRTKPNFLLTRLIAAACAALVGQEADAMRHMDRARQIDPTLRLSNLANVQAMQPEDFVRWKAALRIAGLPD